MGLLIGVCSTRPGWVDHWYSGYLWCRLSNRSSPPQSSQFLHENTIGLGWFLPSSKIPQSIEEEEDRALRCTEKRPTQPVTTFSNPQSQTNLCQTGQTTRQCLENCKNCRRQSGTSVSGFFLLDCHLIDHWMILKMVSLSHVILSRKLESSVPTFFSSWAPFANGFC